MKFNKLMIYGMIFLAILTLGVVNATDNVAADDLAAVSDGGDLEVSLLNDEMNGVSDIPSDDILTDDANEDILEISNDKFESDNLAHEEIDKLALIPVTMDVNVIDNSRVDINVFNVTGNVIVIVDDSENTVPLDNMGSASFPLNNLSAGNHSLVVIYEGDSTYDAAHSVSVFNIPEKPALVGSEFTEFVIGDDLTVNVVLKDKDGNAIANVPVRYTLDGVSGNAKTNAKGQFTIAGKANAVISLIFDGNEKFAGTNTTLILNGSATPSEVKVSSYFNIPGGVITINGYAVDTKAGEEGIYYSTELLDANGKPISGADIQFAVNNKIYNRTTNEKGGFEPYRLNMLTAGRYTMAFCFNGNDKYQPAFASVCVDLDKKPVTIKASAKKYKASAKSKKYTVTLSTIVGSSHDGKAHLSPKKVTLTVAGKTYSGKTNNNGQVTFNLKITKKGKYTAKIKFAGDNTYDAKSKSVKITVK